MTLFYTQQRNGILLIENENEMRNSKFTVCMHDNRTTKQKEKKKTRTRTKSKQRKRVREARPYHEHVRTSSSRMQLPRKLSFSSIGMSSSPSTAAIALHSALSSRRCRRHLSSAGGGGVSFDLSVNPQYAPGSRRPDP